MKNNQFLFLGEKGIAYTLVTSQDTHFTADLVRNLVSKVSIHMIAIDFLLLLLFFTWFDFFVC